jgi:hypothetical protein
MPITREQLIDQKQLVISVAEKFKIQQDELKVYGKILGDNGYQGEQKELNFLIETEKNPLDKSAFERELQDKLVSNQICCSVSLVSKKQLEENLKDASALSHILDEATLLDELENTNCSKNRFF